MNIKQTFSQVIVALVPGGVITTKIIIGIKLNPGICSKLLLKFVQISHDYEEKESPKQGRL